MSWKTYLKHWFKTFCEKYEPYWTGRIIPEALQTDFEEAMGIVFQKPSVIRSYVSDDRCYVIEIEHFGMAPRMGGQPKTVVHNTFIALRRFYLKYGVSVRHTEVHIDSGKYSSLIHVALNTYGLRKVTQLNRVQHQST